MIKKLFWSIILTSFFSIPLDLVAQASNGEISNYIKEVNSYLYRKDKTNRTSRDYFRKIKAYAEIDHAEANCMLGVLFKEGLGTNQNFNKARRAFKKAYELGSDRAAYCLGYMHLKGLGTLPQDYAKAFKWFKRSNDAMAVHWLAKMHFFGLGREKNPNKAKRLLENNPLFNSAILLPQLEDLLDAGEVGVTDIELEEGLEVSLNELQTPAGITNSGHILGKWEGHLLELDWAGEQVIRKLPISLSIEPAQNDSKELETKITVTDSVSSGKAVLLDNRLDFNNSRMPVKKQYTDYPSFTHLMYHLRSMNLHRQAIGEENYLIGKLESYLSVWKEEAPPSILVLKRAEENYGASVNEAFRKQANDFIKLYPNPFIDYLLVHYELESDAQVKVSIVDYYNKQSEITYFQGSQAAGEHTLELTDLPDSEGLYVLVVRVNGEVQSKIVVNN